MQSLYFVTSRQRFLPHSLQLRMLSAICHSHDITSYKVTFVHQETEQTQKNLQGPSKPTHKYSVAANSYEGHHFMNQTSTNCFAALNKSRIMNNEREVMRKEALVAYLTHGAPLIRSGHCT